MLRKIVQQKIKESSKNKKTSTSVVPSTSEEPQIIEEPPIIEENIVEEPVVEEPVVEKKLENEPTSEPVVKTPVTTTKSRGRKVICLTTGEIFDSITQAKQTYKGSIDRACQGKQKTAGVHPETGEKLCWMYYDEYLNGSDIQ